MRILALITDAFGGYGGIALYNRDVLTALCLHPEVSEVVAVPRRIPQPMESLPEKLIYVDAAANGKAAFTRALLKVIRQHGKFDLILCSHVNLMSIAWLLEKFFHVPVILEIYGIEAWQPTERWTSNRAIRIADAVISISYFTQRRFLEWARLPSHVCTILPNAIHLDNYGIGDKPEYLLNRYGLAGKTIILTLGRIVSRERAKGFDEILELLPDLAVNIPNITYIIAGEGEYRPELEAKVQALHLEERVIFTGMINETEKADFYRLADLYAMPSRGEGFGFVFLEAMACGLPVLASKADGGCDAVRNGKLGILVDPDDPEEIKAGILHGLSLPGGIPTGLKYFSFPHFTQRLHAIVNQVVRKEN